MIQDKNVWGNTLLQESRAGLRLECQCLAWQSGGLFKNRQEGLPGICDPCRMSFSLNGKLSICLALTALIMSTRTLGLNIYGLKQQAVSQHMSSGIVLSAARFLKRF